MSDTTTSERERARILVFGDDGSPGADVAWLWICNHEWTGWRAEVLTAQPPPFPVTNEDSATVEEWQSPHPRTLTAPSGLGSVRSLRSAQDPRLLLGSRSDADLIVVGPRDAGRARARGLGSTTEWLLHHPPAPLVVVASARPVRRVLVCVDGSVHAQAAIDAFARLPWAPATEAVLLHVRDNRSDAAAAIDRAEASIAAGGVRFSSELAEGKPTNVILHRIDTYTPDLVVLGTKGLTGWARLRVGSTAGSVVRDGASSYLIACAEG